MSYLFAIILFSFLIFIHELGHFTTAKCFGVQVNEFSLFMGPILWKKQIGETQYSLRMIPLGGFCAMEGEDGDSTNPRGFTNAACWKRLIILAAGAFMNFLAGVLLLAICYAPAVNFVLPVVQSIEEGSALCADVSGYGLQEGDRILSLDGERIYVYSDFSMLLSMNAGDRHDMTILRDGKTVVLTDFLMEKREFPNEDGTTSLRFGFNFTAVEATIFQKLSYTWNSALDTVRLVRLSLKMLFNGQAGVTDLSGPVGIVQQMADVAEHSETKELAILNLLYFGGFIAINLAVMNLLPIPALDGGRILGLALTAIIEMIIGKKINPKYEGYIHAAGMILLLLLMAFIMLKDIIFAIKR